VQGCPLRLVPEEDLSESTDKIEFTKGEGQSLALSIMHISSGNPYLSEQSLTAHLVYSAILFLEDSFLKSLFLSFAP